MRRWEINGKVGSGKLKERERGRRSEKETDFFFFPRRPRARSFVSSGSCAHASLKRWEMCDERGGRNDSLMTLTADFSGGEKGGAPVCQIKKKPGQLEEWQPRTPVEKRWIIPTIKTLYVHLWWRLPPHPPDTPHLPMWEQGRAPGSDSTLFWWFITACSAIQS